MAKLVVLSEGLTGQTYELKVDKTTVGRVEDNAFQIAQPSVSSHHCEIWLIGQDVVVKDLNSTNGTFVNGQQITTEAVLHPGQLLRLGQVEMRLESGSGPSPAPAATATAAPAPGRKPRDSSMLVANRGVSLQQLEQGPQGGLDTSKGFTTKKNQTNKYFVIGIVVFFVVIGVIFLIAYSQSGHH